MQISVELENGLLPDRFGKYAPAEHMIEDHPVLSFPVAIDEVPEGTQSLALTFLDWDAIPVGAFCWIHWLACDFPPETRLIPENASASGAVPCVQGSNSDWSPFGENLSNPDIIYRYVGPQPPDRDHDYTLTVYALDCTLGFDEGYYLNEFRRAIRGHVLAQAELEIPSRA